MRSRHFPFAGPRDGAALKIPLAGSGGVEWGPVVINSIIVCSVVICSIRASSITVAEATVKK